LQETKREAKEYFKVRKNFDRNYPMKAYFRYEGSLTTPSCDQRVTYLLYARKN